MQLILQVVTGFLEMLQACMWFEPSPLLKFFHIVNNRQLWTWSFLDGFLKNLSFKIAMSGLTGGLTSGIVPGLPVD